MDRFALRLFIAGAIAIALGAMVSVSTAAGPVASAAGKRCCKVTYPNKNTAVATGVMRYPKGGRFLYGGLNPPIGACKTDAGPGRVGYRRKFDLRRTPAGRYNFTMVYRYKGKVRYKNSPKFHIRGRG